MSVVIFIVLRRAVADNEIESLCIYIYIYHRDCNKIINCNETTVDYTVYIERDLFFLYSTPRILHECLSFVYTYVLNLI